MNAVIEATATIEVIETTEQPLPIRVIRRVNGRYEFVELQEAEMTDAERRAQFVAMFSIYE